VELCQDPALASKSLPQHNPFSIEVHIKFESAKQQVSNFFFYDVCFRKVVALGTWSGK
jgi:hypothetical protein